MNTSLDTLSMTGSGLTTEQLNEVDGGLYFPVPYPFPDPFPFPDPIPFPDPLPFQVGPGFPTAS